MTTSVKLSSNVRASTKRYFMYRIWVRNLRLKGSDRSYFIFQLKQKFIRFVPYDQKELNEFPRPKIFLSKWEENHMLTH